MAWGNRGELAMIPQVIDYHLDEDDRVRSGVALVLGKLLQGKTITREGEKAIETLGKLGRDRAPSIRKIAIQSLGKVHSDLIIPYLEQGRKDPDMEVVAAASTTLQNYKKTPISASPAHPKELPKNSALREMI